MIGVRRDHNGYFDIWSCQVVPESVCVGACCTLEPSGLPKAIKQHTQNKTKLSTQGNTNIHLNNFSIESGMALRENAMASMATEAKADPTKLFSVPGHLFGNLARCKRPSVRKRSCTNIHGCPFGGFSFGFSCIVYKLLTNRGWAMSGLPWNWANMGQ